MTDEIINMKESELEKDSTDTVINRFVKLDVTSQLNLTSFQIDDLIRQYNLYHLGDEKVNKLDEETMEIVPKYPEKETPEFLNGQCCVRGMSGMIVGLEITVDLENGLIVNIEREKDRK